MDYTNEEMLEAIEVLESAKQHGCRVRDDAIDIAEQAINKQIPKKIICKIYKSENIYLGTSKNYYCPTCNNGLIWDDDKYCKECGQALDWSKNNEQKLNEEDDRDEITDAEFYDLISDWDEWH